MSLISRIVATVLLIFAPLIVAAQGYPRASSVNNPGPNNTHTLAPGSPVQLNAREVYDHGSGTLSFSIPVVSLPQKGGHSLDLAFVYGSNTKAMYSVGDGSSPGIVKHSSGDSDDDYYGPGVGNISIGWWYSRPVPWQEPVHANLPGLVADELFTEYVDDNLYYYGTGDPTDHQVQAQSCTRNWRFTDWQGFTHSFAASGLAPNSFPRDGCRDWAYIDADHTYGPDHGTEMQSPLKLAPATADDDSGFRLDARNANDIVVTDARGTAYHFSGYKPPQTFSWPSCCESGQNNLQYYAAVASKVVDPNGNTISIDCNADRTTCNIVDTMGRQIGVGDSGKTITYTSSASTTPVTATVSLPQASGSAVPVFQDVNACSYASSTGQSILVQLPNLTNPQVRTITVTLQDGVSKYLLTLDPRENLTSVVYPTGGSTTYDYVDVGQTINAGPINCQAYKTAISARHVCSSSGNQCHSQPTPIWPLPLSTATSICQNGGDGSNSPATTCINHPPGDGYDAQVDPFGTQSLRLTPQPGSPNIGDPQLSRVTDRNGTQLSSTVSNTPHPSYPEVNPATNWYWPQYDPEDPCSKKPFGQGPTELSAGIPAPCVTTEYIPISESLPALQKVTRIWKDTYSCPVGGSTIGSGWNTSAYACFAGNNSRVDELNFAGTVVRRTLNTWKKDGTDGYGSNILHLLESSTVYDLQYGTGRTTTNIYDNAGNVVTTTVSSTVPGTPSTTTQYTYTPEGDLLSVKDPMQVDGSHLGATTYDYAPQSSGGCSDSRPGPGRPTKVTNALGQSKIMAYNVDGSIACTRDANGTTTQFQYDALGRQTQVSVNGTVISSMVPSTSLPLTLTTSVTNGATTKSVLDGYGRPAQSILQAPEGQICTASFYDAIGRVSAVSDPQVDCPSVQSPQSSVSYQYDALDRVLVQNNQDGTTKRITYAGATVTSKDEASNTWVRTSDAFGNLINVAEPGGLQTNYTYTGFGDLTDVLQVGNGSETPVPRHFTYDGFSRLLTSTNPETGTVCYGLWSGSTCTNGYDANGNLRHKTDARGVTVNYSYDALNRLIQKTYSGTSTEAANIAASTSPASYIYDQGDVPTTPHLGGTIGDPGPSGNFIGRLTRETTGNFGSPVTSRQFSGYDSMGRLVSEVQCNNGACAPYLQYTYDLAGNLTSAMNGSNAMGILFTYGYDGAGRLASLTSSWDDEQHPGQLLAPVPGVAQYTPAGALASVGFGQLVGGPAPRFRMDRTYDARQRVVSQEVKTTGAAVSASAVIALTAGDGAGNGGLTGGDGPPHGGIICLFCTPVPDSGTLGVDIGGGAFTVSIDYDGESPSTLAQEIADALNQPDGNGNQPLVTATASGAQVNLFSLLAGPAGQYALSVTITSTDDYGDPSGSFTLSGDMQPTAPQTLYRYAIQQSDGTTGYTPNSNIVAYSDSVNGNWTLGYDSLNRLTSSVTGSGASPFGCWSYDSFGNMKQSYASSQAFLSSAGTCQGQTGATTASTDLHYDDSKNRITSGTWRNRLGYYTADSGPWYDDAGNMTHDHTDQYKYDAEGRVCAMQQGSGAMTGYIYDAEGLRVAKGSLTNWNCNLATNGFTMTSRYVLGPGGEQLTETDGSGAWKHTNVYARGSLLATYDGTGLNYQFSDWLGNKRVQVNAGEITQIQTCQNQPFGDEQICTGTLDSTEHHFTGKERDAESGLDYFGARYYGSAMGRFMSPDSPSYAHLSNPQAWNLYSYTYNNPLSFVDPDGHDVACGGVRGAQLLKDANGATNGGGRVVCNTKTTDHSFLGLHWSTTTSTLGVTGDPATFKALGQNASRLLDLINNHSFTLTVNYGSYNASPGGSTSNMLSQGFSTPSVFIDPSRPNSGYDNDAAKQGIPEANTAEEFGHEVLGHQWGELINGDINSRLVGAGIAVPTSTTRANMRDSITGENAVRALDPSRGQKRIDSHHNYLDAPKDGN